MCSCKYQPPIAQLVERETVGQIQYQISLGRWFKSGSVDYFLIAVKTGVSATPMSFIGVKQFCVFLQEAMLTYMYTYALR